MPSAAVNQGSVGHTSRLHVLHVLRHILWIVHGECRVSLEVPAYCIRQDLVAPGRPAQLSLIQCDVGNVKLCHPM